MKKLIFISALIYFGPIRAQEAQPRINTIDKVVSHFINNNLEIEFGVNKKTGNLLILLSDSTGHTVFLDSKYDFAGNYSKVISLAKKGKYYLKVRDDEEEINKTLIIE